MKETRINRMQKSLFSLSNLVLILIAIFCLSCAQKQTSQESIRDRTAVIDTQQTSSNEFHGRTVRLPEKKIAQGLGIVSINFEYPRGYQFTDQAPSKLAWTSSNGKSLSFGDGSTEGNEEKIVFPYDIPVEAGKGESELMVEASVFFCADKSKICFFDNVRIVAPIKVSKDGTHKLSFNVDVEGPDDFR